MKRTRLDRRSALLGLRLSMSLALATVVPLVLFGSAPSWWTQRGVLAPNAVVDDFAPVNQGQLKNVAKSAVAEMDAKLVGGAGGVLHGLIDSWSIPSERQNDFAPVNLGQLKAVARPFYDRLIAIGVVDSYPWLQALGGLDDFAVANVGQVKNLFSFQIPSPNSLSSERNRLAAGELGANLALEQYAVWSWGDHFANGSEIDRNYPRRRADLSAVSSVAAGKGHLVALGNDGTVSTWGENARGQLGDGTYVARASAAAVPNLSNIVSVKAGGFHTLALRGDGTVLVWGDNEYGQLGVGNTIASPVPVVVPSLVEIRKIAAGYQRSAALAADGTLWTWGYDHYLWHDFFNTFPIAVPDLYDVVDVAAGYEHLVVVKADGTVWAWGSNYADQLGNGNSPWIFQDTPAQVSKLGNIIRIASSFEHNLALAADGTVWAWGKNFSGQLGDGTTNERQVPIEVVGLTNIIAIATADTYSLAMKADGTVWAWGEGAVGTLPGTDRHVPQQVGLGLLDNNHNGLDDRWEIQYFGNLTQTGDGDVDGDGISNLKEFLRGTNPADYFNGVAPILEITGGNNQIGEPGTFLGKPFKVQVRNAAGQLLVNAPIRFTPSSGSVASIPNGPQESSLLTRTDVNGEALAYHVLSDYPGSSTRTIASAESSEVSAMAAFRGVVKFSLPTPVPSTTPPDPNATPTPTPAATSTPIAPYRYAIIDLGKDLNPLRVNNKGWVLLSGFTADGEWAYYRWKAGTMKRLTYSSPTLQLFTAVDMNDEGVVVGSFRQAKPWVNNAENYIGGGLTWAPDSSQAIDTPAPITARTWDFNRTGTVNWAGFTAINNQDEIFGVVRTSGGYGLFFRTFDVFNAYSSTRGLLSFGEATFSGSQFPTADAFSVRGDVDRVFRANGNGHYIGTKLTLQRVTSSVPPGLDGIYSDMVDGHSVAFAPIDINESAIIVGSAGADMVVYSSPTSQITINDTSPVAINDHIYPAPTSQSSSVPSPMAAPQILAWTNGAPVIWERQPDGQTWHPFGLEEMIPSMDGWQYLDPYDMNDAGVIVGSAWYTDPSVPNAPGEYHAFMLVPAEIVPDFNRDGKIDDNDRGQVTESNPWRWWINDDDDSAGDIANGDDDIPGATHPDGQETSIQGIRDLIDYFPLYFDIKNLVKAFPPGPNIEYKFKQGQENLRFAYTELRPGTVRDFLVRLDGDHFDNAPALSNVSATRATADGIPVNIDWLNSAAFLGRGVLLVEGRAATDKPLILEISIAGHKVTELRFELGIDAVETMFRHINLMGADNSAGGRATELGVPSNYPDSMCNDKSFVFVHGFNVTLNAAKGWNAEMFKRLHQAGSRAKFYGVTWHGAETNNTIVPDYHKNVDNAFATATAFAEFTKSLLGPVAVLGHSLANVVVGSSLHDWSSHIDNYFMVDAAVPLEAYEGSVARDPEMIESAWRDYPESVWASEWHANSTFSQSDRRRNLTWRNRFSRVRNETHNLFASSEDVLRKQEGDPTFLRDILWTQIFVDQGLYTWALQEKLKGLQIAMPGAKVGSTYGGWQFSKNIYPPGETTAVQALALSEKFLTENPIFDPGFSIRVSPPPPGGQPPPRDTHVGAPDWISDLTDSSKGSATAELHANQLLAEMFPARTLPAGANTVNAFAERNINMPEIFMTERDKWPRARVFASSPEWRHSDIKNVAYSHLFRLFDSVVNDGNLRQ